MTREDLAAIAEDLTERLAVIPAPSGQEAARAAFCRDWLRANGMPAEVDEIGNVTVAFGDPLRQPTVLLMAHTDLVFDADVPLTLRRKGNRLYCPGIGDDTVHVAMLLAGALWIQEQLANGRSTQGICLLYAANVCEEGEGNLKGCRALMERYGSQLQEVISFDSSLEKMHTVAVGSMRYRVTVKTRGGHSFRDFGAPNAIALLAELITVLNGQSLPTDGKTTFNFGKISGGTTVNSIAAEACMLYEFRSDRQENLRQMEKQFRRAVKQAQTGGCEIAVDSIGVRPCAENVPAARMQALQARVEHAFDGLPLPQLEPASTDCNLPLSMGIPAICIGLADCKGAHTTQEYYVPGSLVRGAQVLTALLDSYLLP